MSPARVRLRLEVARDAGASFAEAWPVALELADQEWRAVLEATRQGWRRAFEGAPQSRGERALVLLFDDERVPVDSRRYCRRCAKAIPAGAHGNQVYCTRACRRLANDRPVVAA